MGWLARFVNCFQGLLPAHFLLTKSDWAGGALVDNSSFLVNGSICTPGDRPDYCPGGVAQPPPGPPQKNLSPPHPRTHHRPTRPVRSRTERELLRLVGGNRAVADRLVEQVQLRNPQHSEQWCWEKAIYDIQRDRHSS